MKDAAAITRHPDLNPGNAQLALLSSKKFRVEARQTGGHLPSGRA
jgi:hypothetical protein